MTSRAEAILRSPVAMEALSHIGESPMGPWGVLRAWLFTDEYIAHNGWPTWAGRAKPPPCPGIDGIERLLRRLHAAGLLDRAYMPRNSGYRRHNGPVYALSRAGHEALVAWLRKSRADRLQSPPARPME